MSSEEIGRHLRLGPPDEGDATLLQHAGHPVGGGAGRPQRGELAGVLDGPHRGGDHRGGDPSSRREPTLEVEHGGGPGPVGDGATAPAAPAGRPSADRPARSGPGRRSTAQANRSAGLGHPRCLERRHHQGRLAHLGEDEHGQALERHGPVPGQPGQVGSVGQQQRVNPEVVHPLAHALEAARPATTGRPRAAQSPDQRPTRDGKPAPGAVDAPDASAACRAW